MQMVSYRASLWLSFASLVVVGGVTLLEHRLVDPELHGYYVGGRILLFIVFLIHMLFYKQNQKVWYGVVWVSLFYLSSALGEYCRPLYILSLFQIQVVHAIYFKNTRISYFATNIIGTLFFASVMVIAWPQNIVRLQQPALADQMSIAFVALLAAMFIFAFFESMRKQSAAFTKKLALAGGYATSLIHDIKNLSAAPLLYSEILADRGRKLSDEDYRRMMSSLNEDLKRMEYVVKELYNASKVSQATYTDCSLRDICLVASDIVRERLNNIDVRINGDATVRTDKTILQMMILNLFYNATTALRYLESDRTIEIEIDKNGFSFTNRVARDHQSSAPKGVGLALMNELGQQCNLALTYRLGDDTWTSDVRVQSAWTSTAPILASPTA